MTGLSRKEQVHIATLQRRVHHLHERIKSAPVGRCMDWDRRELSALRWIIERLYGIQERIGTEKRSKRPDSEKP